MNCPRAGVWTIEIKRSSAPTVSKGLHIAADDVNATARFVVHSGKDSFLLANGVQATTLLDLQQPLVNLGAGPEA